ncbi:MAG TPA: Gfo/Idh/MocA family oxidoreductase [Pseudolysinimonas sp.]|nr:Gfo/Idh/MocA family oxidoreductase [Pseudolysinimonas sp.]
MSTPAAEPPTQRWAIVGTGMISRSIIDDLARLDDVEIAVVHSRDAAKAARFAEELGIPRSTGDYADLLADPTIEVIYLATPIATHHQLATQALTAGKHVLVEKPMAATAAEVEDLFHVATEHGVFLMEAMWMKFNPAHRRLHEVIASGRIGEPRSLRASFGVAFPQDGSSRWHLDAGGGALLDQGIYPVTFAYTFFGEPTAVHAVARSQPDGLDFGEHVTLEFAGDRYAQCASDMTAFNELSASVGGTTGWVTVPAPFWVSTTFAVHADDQQNMFQTPEQVHFEQEGNGYVPMLRATVDAIKDKQLQHPIHPAGDTIAVFRILDQIRSQIGR